VFTAPKTRGSAAGVGLSSRVVAALEAQRARQDAERTEWGEAYQDGGLVFAREDGHPLRPEYVLTRFYALSDAARLPRKHLHDLRHAAATLMLTAGVPLALVSKVLRHTKVSITSDLYGHLTREAGMAAVDAAAAALDAAAAARRSTACDHNATTGEDRAPLDGRPR
jgi:integrase